MERTKRSMNQVETNKEDPGHLFLIQPPSSTEMRQLDCNTLMNEVESGVYQFVIELESQLQHSARLKDFREQ